MPSLLNLLRLLIPSSHPSAPTNADLILYPWECGGRDLPHFIGSKGWKTPLQPSLFNNRVAAKGPGSSTTIAVFGCTVTNVGTVSTPTLATTNLHTSMRLSRITSAATANSGSESYTAANMVWRGNASGLGGFHYCSRFAVNSTTSLQRLFVGLQNSTTGLSLLNPISNLTDMVGFGWDSADTNLQIMTNDNTGTATKVDLGSNFPANNTTAVYEVHLFAGPNASSIFYEVIRLDTGNRAFGELTTDLPRNTVFLTWHEHINNGGTAAAVVLDLFGSYLESPV